MVSRAEIELLASQKLAAAKCLFDNGFYADAYYLAGYSIELYLKAMICKTLDTDNFYSPGIEDRKEVLRVFKSHNYKTLLLLSGIENEFETAKQQEPYLITNWNTVIEWSEVTRYHNDKEPHYVKNFINSSKTICTWIQKHL